MLKIKGVAGVVNISPRFVYYIGKTNIQCGYLPVFELLDFCGIIIIIMTKCGETL